ncbi:hypothetical protein BU15DRAFT_64997 [Melanogaster broomeanus]|nr:hypothetical protein BU15DRAFT_64997 [Melanogaster broomeanus]
MNAPRPGYPPVEILVDGNVQTWPNILPGVDPARSTDASQGSSGRLSSTTVEDIFTSATAPIPEGEEFPRDQSPPPAPTLPPWDLIDEDNSLGLHDGDIIETTIVDGVPHTIVRNPQRVNTTNNHDREEAETNETEDDEPEARQRIGEPKGKERARDEPAVETPSVPPLSSPESQHQGQSDTDDPFRSSNRMKFRVHKRKSSTSTTSSFFVRLIPPTTVASSANSLHHYTPPPTAHASGETPPKALQSDVGQPTPLSIQTEAQTPLQAETQTQYLTPDTLSSRAPQFTNNSEAGSSRHGTPAEQYKHEYLSRSIAQRQISRHEDSVTERRNKRGLASTEKPSMLGTAPLVMSPEQIADVFAELQNRDETGTNEETQPAARPFTGPAPSQDSSWLRGDPPARPRVYSGTAARRQTGVRELLGQMSSRQTYASAWAFANCGTLSSETLGSVESAYQSLITALIAVLSPLIRDVDTNIDLSDDRQLSWADRYEETVTAMQRALNRAVGLVNEFPRGDRVRRHLASVSQSATRLTYLARKLEDSIERIAYLRLSSQLKAKNEVMRKAKMGEDARREAYNALADRRTTETEGIRQKIRQIKAGTQRRPALSHGSSEESELESA